MKSLLFILVIVYSISSPAQKIRFTDSRNTWSTNGGAGIDGGTFSSYLSFGADTIKNSHTYKQLNATNSGTAYSSDKNILVREDTVANLVYSISLIDTTEQVLYNYNLKLHDTIQYTLFYAGIITDTVIGLDSIIINGIYHKVWKMFSGNSISYYARRVYTVVEGIGSTINPESPISFGGCFEYEEKLHCFTQDTSILAINVPYFMCYANANDSFHNCSALAAGGVQKQAVRITFSPNPASDHIDITSSSTFVVNTFISVYDITGKRVYYASADVGRNSKTISTTTLHDGLYLVVLQNNTGILNEEKIIIDKNR